MRRRGLSLIELLLALFISTMISGSLALAFSSVSKIIREEGPDEELRMSRLAAQDRLRDLIQAAFVSPNEDDQDSFFIGRIAGQGQGIGSGEYSDELLFTTLGRRVPGKALYNDEEEFEIRNETLGPIGGQVEYGISTTPVGDAGDAQGLYLRAQTPADTDPEQGGYESVLTDEITSVGFEFYDGTSWVSTWDTTTGERRLPAAVRVVYTVTDNDQEYNFVIRIPQSDVTPDNPLNSGGAQ